MNLEEIKAGWNVLNERLAKNEILNHRIIKEMITTRTRTAYEKVCNWEWWNLSVLLFIGGILFPGEMFISGHPMKWLSFIIAETGILVALIWKILTISYLMKFKLETSKIGELMRLLLIYKRFRWYDKVYGMILGIMLLAAIIIIENIYVLPSALMAIGIMLVLGLSLSFIQLRTHAQRIKTIEQGLAELKEFEA